MAKYKVTKTSRKYSKFLSLEKKNQEKKKKIQKIQAQRYAKKVIFGNSVLALSPEISESDVVVRISGPTGVIVKHSKAVEIVANVLTKIPSKMISRLGYDLME